jgi:hypothetical protein
MASLASRQQAFAGGLLGGDMGAVPAVHARDAHDRAARLRVYAQGYRWRLVEVLGNDYPVLRVSLGADRFDVLAARYLDACPSRHPSVRHVGARFPRWLATHASDDRVRSDLARLEWRQGEVFDAPDASPCTLDDLLAVPHGRWPQLRVTLHPAVRRLRLRSNAVALLDAHARGIPLPRLAAQPLTDWLLWRHDFDVHWRRLPRDEAMALAAVARGDAFADWCVRLPGAAPALRAAGLLKRWLTDGLVTGLSTS